MANRCTIYQIQDDSEARDMCFRPLEEWKDAGMTPHNRHYTHAWTVDFTERATLEDTAQILDEVYRIFNMAPPEGYRGRSVSMSDILVLELQGRMTAYYVDRIGFKDVTDEFVGRAKA